MTSFIIGGIVGAVVYALIRREESSTLVAVGMVLAYLIVLGYAWIAGWPAW